MTDLLVALRDVLLSMLLAWIEFGTPSASPERTPMRHEASPGPVGAISQVAPVGL